ncbi:MAG: hypothetical protein PHT69_02990 [Bacteroidales bacterium]|nr:hypothetical protein [Bacteroidales bacterium]
MEQRDYLMRQVNQLARVLGKVLFDLLGLKNSGEIIESINITTLSLMSELDIDLDELVSIKRDELIHTLIDKMGFNNENLETLSEILMQMGDNFFKINNLNKGESYCQTSLFIYEYLEKADNTYSLARREKIEKLKTLLTHKD